MDLSILFPIYKPDNIAKTLESLKNSVHKVSYEIIIVGPNAPDEILCDNVSYVKCMGSPIKSLQIASLNARGEYVSITADDAWYRDNAVDNIFDIFDAHDRSPNIAVQARYLEAPGRRYTKKSHKILGGTNYWMIQNSITTASAFFPSDGKWKIFTYPFMKLDHFRKVGGFDCRFEGQAMGFIDLGNRIQRSGTQIIVTDFFVVELDNVPGIPPDRYSGHGPMYFAQVENDQPLYRSIYSDPDCVNRVQIPYDNWKDVEDTWNRRKK